MSNMSSDNPYASPSLSQAIGGDPNAPLSGAPKIYCILFIILGALGLLGTAQAIFGFVFLLVLPADQFNPMTVYPGAMIVSIAFAVTNFVVSIAQIFGGTMGLKRKLVGATMIWRVSAFMLVCKVLETVNGTIVQYLSMGPTIAQTLKQMPPQPANGPDIEMLMGVGMYFGIGLGIFFGVIMFVFYLSSFLTFGRQRTLSKFS
jgi:hypothetical protein